MADEATFLGDISNGPFETVGRDDSWAENRTATFQIVGKWKTLSDLGLKPCDSMSRISGCFPGGISSDYYVKTTQLSRDGEVGTLNITAVKCPSGVEQPYNVIWESSMDEVQKKLINHPDVVENCDVSILWKWMETPAQYRVKVNKEGEVVYCYTTGEVEGDTPVTEEITGDWEIKYCKAVTAGIETFNFYLPVVSKTSYYLKLPGVLYTDDHVAESGTIALTEARKIGTFDEPNVKPSCVPRGPSGGGAWFKSMDKIIENSDGSCTRTEQWTYTNDTQHGWIYGGD